MDEDTIDPNNERGKYVSKGTMMEISTKVNEIWQKYVKEGKIIPQHKHIDTWHQFENNKLNNYD